MFPKKTFIHIYFALMVLVSSTYAGSKEYQNDSKAKVIEIANFKLQEGKTIEQFLAADQRVEVEHVSKQPGFISRETAHNENGTWLIVVRWESIKDAEASMQSFMQAPATSEFMGVIDGASMTMQRYSIK